MTEISLKTIFPLDELLFGIEDASVLLREGLVRPSKKTEETLIPDSHSFSSNVNSASPRPVEHWSGASSQDEA